MADISIQDINSAIINQKWTVDDLNAITQATKYARERLAKVARWTFKPGDKVKFTDTRSGRTHYGEVTKVKIKKIVVREGMVDWNVPASMLEAN